MEDLIQKLCAKTGIDEATAKKVVKFLEDHAGDVVSHLHKNDLLSKIPGGLGDRLGKLF